VPEFCTGHVTPEDALMVEESVGFDEVEDAEFAEGSQDYRLVNRGSCGIEEAAVLFEHEGRDAGLTEADGYEQAYRPCPDDDGTSLLLA